MKCPICEEEMIPDVSGGWRICKKCRRQFQAVYRKRRCLSYLGNKCSHCGRNDIDVLTFHHKDPKTKSFNVSEWISGIKRITFEEVKKELDKCEILCLNCHKRVHTNHRELKEFIPYLTQQQCRELESDIITDDELEAVIDNPEAVRDILMETDEIPVRSFGTIVDEVHQEHSQEYSQEHSNYIRSAKQRSDAILESRPGGILGITDVKEERTCCYCGEKFMATKSSVKIFCSDYCKEQAREEAVDCGEEDLFDYLTLHGFALTGSVYRMKEKVIRQKLHLNRN
jgi:5-methylcytosine-specific restriction endonuclease McrA